MPYPIRSLVESLANNISNPDKRPGHGTAWPTRQLHQIRQVVLHHTASPDDATPEGLNAFHHSRGWWRLSYHYLVKPDGMQLKINRNGEITWGVYKANTPSIHICLLGNRAIHVVPFDQWQSAVELAAKLATEYHIRLDRILGHGMLTPTTCPGQYVDVVRFRADLATGAPA